jgi:hypothetical protein
MRAERERKFLREMWPRWTRFTYSRGGEGEKGPQSANTELRKLARHRFRLNDPIVDIHLMRATRCDVIRVLLALQIPPWA